MTPAPTAWTTLAHLLRPQGRKGELLAELLTDFPERFEHGARVFLAPPEFSGPESEARLITVSGHWLPVGRNHGRIVLHFAAIDSIEAAETLTGLDVLVPADERIELDDDAEYISDLLDCEVYAVEPAQPEAPTRIGRVTAVDFAMSPDGIRRLPDTAPLLTVRTDAGEEILIPYVQSFLLNLDPANHRIDMQLPPGLLDLNRTVTNSY